MLRKRKQPKKNKIGPWQKEFLKEYRDTVFSSVSNRNNTYSKYYDTQSQAYKDMVEFTTGDGVRKAKIDYYTPGALDIQRCHWKKMVWWRSRLMKTLPCIIQIAIQIHKTASTRPTPWKSRCKLCDYGYCRNKKNHRRFPHESKIFQINFGDSCLVNPDNLLPISIY